LVVAAIQINSNNNSKENLKKVLYFMDMALDVNPDIIVLPEYTNYMGPLDKALPHGLSKKSMWHKTLSGFAKMNNTGLVVGLLLKADNGKASSSVLYFNKKGICRSSYQKLHLFDVNLEDTVVFRESDYLSPGSDPGIFSIDKLTCGVALCYDLRFPELFRDLVAKNARVIFLPAAFTDVTGEAHWEILVRARAIENQVYMIAVNQVGNFMKEKASYGMSMIVDPWGTVIAKAPGLQDDKCETIISASLDFSYQDTVRKKLPCLSHIRKDIFG